LLAGVELWRVAWANADGAAARAASATAIATLVLFNTLLRSTELQSAKEGWRALSVALRQAGHAWSGRDSDGNGNLNLEPGARD
jgi:hypothetical protein